MVKLGLCWKNKTKKATFIHKLAIHSHLKAANKSYLTKGVAETWTVGNTELI